MIFIIRSRENAIFAGFLLLLLVLFFLALGKTSLYPGILFAKFIEKKADQGKDINILLMGIDARPGETIARSDTLILLSIHPSIKPNELSIGR